MKYKNPLSKDVIGFELFINWDEPLILCEGVFDCIQLREMYSIIRKNHTKN